MRAELDASLCVPEKHPVSVEVDPMKAEVGLSGKPGVDVTPLRLMLPKVSVDAPDLTLNLPDPRVTITVSTGNGLLTYLQDLSNFINGLGGSAGDVAVAALLVGTGGAFLAVGAAQALLMPSLRIDVATNLGEFKLTGDTPMTIDFGALRLHAESIKEDVRPMGLDIDLDNAKLNLVIDKLKAALSGCVVLNGGNPPDVFPPCGQSSPPTKPIVRSIQKDYDEGRKPPGGSGIPRLNVEITGDDFGQNRGQSQVVLNRQGASFTPSDYGHWDDTRSEWSSNRLHR